MSHVESGTNSGALWAIDALSLAGRVTEYDTSGNELNPSVQGIYMLPISVRFSAALAVSGVPAIWAMRVDASASVNVYLRKIFLRSSFDGTEVASSLELQLIRFTAATPTAGTSLTPIPIDATYPASVVSDARVSTGAALLTTTSVTVDTNGYFAAQQQARRNDSNCELDIEYYSPNDPWGLMKMTAGDGVLIRINTATVIGDTLGGYILWEER